MNRPKYHLQKAPLDTAKNRQSRRSQYEMLVPYYEEESQRYEALSKRAAAYLSVLGVASAFAVFKVDEMATIVASNELLMLLSAAMLFAVLACVLLIANAVRIRDYKTAVDPIKFVLKAEAGSFSDEDSYSELLAGLVAATRDNRLANNRCAELLKQSLWCGAAAITIFVAINVVVLATTFVEARMGKDNQNPTGKPTSQSAATPAPPPASRPIADLISEHTSVVVNKGTTVPRKEVPVKPGKPASGGG